MARKPRFGQRTWNFSDGGNKFNGRPRPVRLRGQKPISPALKRGVIHCKRCGSRVVGNVANCPFCGRPLRPVYARFWFWLIVVVVVAGGVILLVNTALPEESTMPSSPAEPELPRVVGAAEDSSLKELPLGTTIDNSGLEVTVSSVAAGLEAANGARIHVVEVEFINDTEEAAVLYSTQWMLELSDGTRLDTFVGSAADGATISSNFEAYTLAPNGRFSGRLYFAVAEPAATEEEDTEEGATSTDTASTEPAAVTPSAVVYQPSALAYKEELLVTWRVAP
ncbi:MAG: zinc ribbon domain-containing protein [Coriobacteriales bacterium]|nr:zinc ribbon domain-containing protein [Coriobacteriales bacterium]